ncbi:hypothetical protein DM02DRAFT_689331 [Periconia macrospinosa]|uniref:Uncharacterized protein n=1 Tax=Periconia macrospinosa TaxID=97972 RepID=A0A2V1DDX8_9PLEO|nr:hypothetical protein DM02DRAFT_689331 [Periconia macrospinosa]
MEVDRCVGLHNEIMKIGWEARSNDASALNQSWFGYYRQDAENIRERLSPELIAFLERAWVVGDGHDHSFFYYVCGLHHPNHFFSDNSSGSSNVTLYAANDIGEHPDGLMYH